MLGYMRLKQTRYSGFTIVELLIVVVVIGILAALTLVAFNGVNKRAIIASMKSELSTAAKVLHIDKVDSNLFPETKALANGGKGLKASPNTSFQYTVDNTVKPPTFCLTAFNGTLSYYVTQDASDAREGACPGHTAPTGETSETPNTFTTVTLTTPTTAIPGSHSWSSVAMSADGTKALIGDSISTGQLYTSTDSGATWTGRTGALYGNKFWSAVAMSADGTKMFATVNNGSVWSSTDSGLTWTENTLLGARTWNAIAMSADGTKVGITSSGPTTGTVWTSEDGGANWTQVAMDYTPSAFTDIDYSNDGTVRVISRTNSLNMLASVNGGVWGPVNAFAGGNWRRVACSANCSTWITGVTSGGTYYTTTGGARVQTSMGSMTTTGVAVSDDGQKMLVAPQSGRLWSTVTGPAATWTQIGTTAQTNSWTDIVMSGDGTKFIGVGSNVIYIGTWQ